MEMVPKSFVVPKCDIVLVLPSSSRHFAVCLTSVIMLLGGKFSFVNRGKCVVGRFEMMKWIGGEA